MGYVKDLEVINMYKGYSSQKKTLIIQEVGEAVSPCQHMKCIDLSVYFSFIVAKCESNLCNVEALRDLKVELIARKDVSMIILASVRENLSSVFANNKSADQPAHLHRLISTFVVHFLESMISKLASGEIKFFLSSLCS